MYVCMNLHTAVYCQIFNSRFSACEPLDDTPHEKISVDIFYSRHIENEKGL